MLMNRFLYVGLFALLFLAACSGSVETTTLPATDTVSASETDSTMDKGTPTDPVIPTDTTAPIPERDLEIVTLLPRDAIPAIDNPVFLSAEEADLQYEPDELVIGVNFDGDARAYSIPKLSSHEIVNDTVGGRKIAVTW
jgi:hypothetical protein